VNLKRLTIVTVLLQVTIYAAMVSIPRAVRW